MSKPIPTIAKFMTTLPHTIRPDLSLAAADRLMREHGIRHLPVLEGGRLVGMLSQRDIRLVESFQDIDPEAVKAEEAMSQDIYEVEPTAALDAVASTMAEHKYGSAIVTQNSKVVGIFTTVDALRALAELLHTRLSG